MVMKQSLEYHRYLLSAHSNKEEGFHQYYEHEAIIHEPNLSANYLCLVCAWELLLLTSAKLV